MKFSILVGIGCIILGLCSYKQLFPLYQIEKKLAIKSIILFSISALISITLSLMGFIVSTINGFILIYYLCGWIYCISFFTAIGCVVILATHLVLDPKYK